MNMPTSKDDLTKIIKSSAISARLFKSLRFDADQLAAMPECEMLAISNKSGNEGVLLVLAGDLAVLPYTIGKTISDTKTGRTKSVICDFCFTWQQGGKAASITFVRASDKHTFTYLCCADLQCSLHVRNLTSASMLSRTQLHEDITTSQRIARLQAKLIQLVQQMTAGPAKT